MKRTIDVLHLNGSKSFITSALCLNTVGIAVPIAFFATIVVLSVKNMQDYTNTIESFAVLDQGLTTAAASFEGTFNPASFPGALDVASKFLDASGAFVK
jgi:hypothetical protein